MATRPRMLSATIIVLCTLLAATTTLRAHAPHSPYDDTRFAPITRFGPSIGIEVVASGDPEDPTKPPLTAPLKAVAAPGLPDHLFVVDQVGILWVVNLKTDVRTTFLDAKSLIVQVGVCGDNSFDERGLLGVAFHPHFEDNGRFYTYTSEPEEGAPTFFSTVELGTADHQNVVSEWEAVDPRDPTKGTRAGRRVLIRVNWPQFNHDGGDLAFGPRDGKLYISMGDGGSADDADGQLFITARPRFPNPGCANQVATVGHQGNGNAQKLNVPLGKILRIDVDGRNSANGQYGIPADNPFVNRPAGQCAPGPTCVKEIWAYGFRNPFRMSFDRESGALFVGDVGQNDIEEVNIVKKGGNHGWNFKEGTLFFHINGTDVGFASRERDPARTVPHGLVDPIAQYDTHHEGHSVIGGFVYRGRGVPSLANQYVFGDFALLFKFPSGPHDYGRLFAFDPNGANGGDGQHGLRPISQLHVLPGGALSLALLGIGQDARGELYALGNVNGIPFGNDGKVLLLVPADARSEGEGDHSDEPGGRPKDD